VRKSRRQIVKRIVEAIAVSVIALNILAFYLIYRPLGTQAAAEARHYTELRQSVRDLEVRVDRLEKFQAELPETGKALQDFMTNRIPPRRQAYSVAAHLVHKVGDAAGVKVMTMGYHLESEQHDPLERLALDINVVGSYAGLMKFSHGLETANDFMLVRQFTFVPGENGALNLRLGADLYLTP